MKENPRNRGLAATLTLTGIPASLGVVCLSPVLPLMEEAYSSQPEVIPFVKYVSVCIGIGMVMGAPIAGAVSDRFGRRVTGRVRQGGVISAVAVGHRQAALAVMCRG
jgi:MFS family permease